MPGLDLTGKRSLVCGSSQGIGRAVATALAGLGASVTLMARNRDALQRIAGELPRAARAHDVAVADFANLDSLTAAIRELGHESDPIHILINNTGGPAGGMAIDASADEYLAAFKAHLIANQMLAQALTPAMKRANYGRIINIISTSVKAPIPGLGVSNTIRAAVANWSKTLAAELAPHAITVNNILPGFTRTERLAGLIKARAAKQGVPEDAVRAEMIRSIPAGRFGEPDEVASAAAFLATPAAAYINGINLPVDGGRTQSL